MSRIWTRREFLRTSAVGLAAAGAAVALGSIAVRPPDMGLPNPYPELPKKAAIPPAGKTLFLNAGQYALVAALASLIVPGDEGPGAAEALAADYLDRLIARSKARQKEYTQGLEWIDRFSKERYGREFAGLGLEAQIEVLRYTENAGAMRARPAATLLARVDRKVDTLWDDWFGAGGGIRFFRTLRHDVFCAYYSSPVGWKEFGYYGPPVPAGYPGYDEAPSFGAAARVNRGAGAEACQDCHPSITRRPAHRRPGPCTGCHPSHFPVAEGVQHVEG